MTPFSNAPARANWRNSSAAGLATSAAAAQVDPAGHTAIIVDDGLATGATMKAALIAMKRQGAAKVCVAVPVAPEEALKEIGEQADLVVCLHPAKHFYGVGAFYDDFHQLTDEETVGLLRQGWAESRDTRPGAQAGPARRQVAVPPLGLVGDLCVPAEPARHRSVRPWQRIEPAQPAQRRRRGQRSMPTASPPFSSTC